MNALRPSARLLSALLALALLCSTVPSLAAPAAQQASAATWLLSGRVYEGATGTEPPTSLPLAGVTVTLYGSRDPTQIGTDVLDTDITDASGWFGLTIPNETTFEYFSLVETNPAGYNSNGARSSGGTVKSADWIQYTLPLSGKTLTGNKFWDQPLVTRTPTNTRTVAPPTVTRTPTTTSVGPTATATLVPPTPTRTLPPATRTFTPTAGPTATGTRTPLTATPTRTAAPPTPTATTPAGTVTFLGRTFTVTDAPEPEPIPEAGVWVSLLGSMEPDQPSEWVERAQTDADGLYQLSCTDRARAFEYLWLGIEDEGYETLEVVSGSGGQIVGGKWIRFQRPPAGVYDGNDFALRDFYAVPDPPPVASKRNDCLRWLQNGSFEDKWEHWEHSGQLTVGPGFSSSSAALLGGVNHSTAELTQRTWLPPEADIAQLEFYWTASAEVSDWGDTLDVVIQHAGGADRLATLQVPGIPKPDEWYRKTIDLSAYLGQEVAVTFLAQNNGDIPTTFAIDDVTLAACGAGAYPTLEWRLGGIVYEGEPGDQSHPKAGVSVSLYGAQERTEQGDQLSSTVTTQDGSFTLLLEGYQAQTYPYLGVEVEDPNYHTVSAVPCPGGEVLPWGRVLLPEPSTGQHSPNVFYVQRSEGPYVPVQVPLIPVMPPLAQPGPTPPNAIDVFVRGVEVSQGIQCFDQSSGYTSCPDNSLQLISGKQTVVRVYLGCTGCAGQTLYNLDVDLDWIPNKATIGAYGAMLGGQTSSITGFNLPLGQTLAQLRAKADNTANFILTPSGMGLTLRATVDPDNAIPETNENNNSRQLSLGLASRSLDAVSMLVYYRPQESTATGEMYTDNAMANDSSAAGSAWVMQQLFPMTINYQPLGYFLLYSAKAPAGVETLNCTDIRDDQGQTLLGQLDKAARLATSKQPDLIVGWLPQMSGFMDIYHGPAMVWGGAQGNTVFVVQDALKTGTFTDDGWALAHLAARSVFGVKNPDSCSPGTTIGEIGFDLFKFTVRSETRLDVAFDQVSASKAKQPAGCEIPKPDGWKTCSYPFRTPIESAWISPYTWSRLLKEAQDGTWSMCGGSAGASSATASAVGPTRSGLASAGQAEASSAEAVALISGRAFAAGGAELDPLLQVEGPLPIDASEPEGEYCLELLNGVGWALYRHCFDVSFASGTAENLTWLDTAPFTFALPLPGSARQLVLKQGTEVLASRTASAHAPTVEIVHPAAGETVTDTLTIQLTANDADGDALTYALFYQTGPEAPWWPVGLDLSGPAPFLLDATHLAGGIAARVRVLASDGFSTTAVESAAFSVPRKPPLVSVAQPAQDQLLTPEMPIVLGAVASDLEDGALQGDSLEWVSDRAGLIGRGTQWVLPGGSLAPGRHLITVTAIDSDGQVGQARVSVLVGSRAFLPIVARRPAPGTFLFGDDFTLGGLEGWTANHGDWGIYSERMEGEYDAENAWNISDQSADNLDYAATVTLIQGNAVGLTFRSSVDGLSSYDLILDAVDGVIKLSKRSPYRVLAQTQFAVERNHPYRLRVRAVGSTLEGYLDGEKWLTVTDATYSGGRLGVMLYKGWAGYDDIEAWTLP